MMKNKKLLILVCTSFLLFSCGKNEEPEEYHKIVTSTVTYSEDLLKYSKELTYSLNFKDFVTDTHIFSRELAKFSAVVMNSTSAPDKIKFITYTSGGVDNDDSLYSLAFADAGFKDLDMIDVVSEYNKNDQASIFIGHQVFTEINVKHHLFGVYVDGYPDNSSWASNFDVGADNDIYKDIDGNSKDWMNKKHHKGFDATANCVYTAINEYMSQYKVDGIEPIVYLVGHSRGAAISNILGKLYTDAGVSNVVYAFNTPSFTTENDPTLLTKYDTIHNLLCEEDLVSKVFLEKWGFRTYGTNHLYSQRNNKIIMDSFYDEDLVFLSEEGYKSFLDATYTLSKSRNGLYEFRDEPNILEFGSLEDLNELKDTITNFGNARMQKLIKTEVSYNDEEKKHVLSVKTCPAILLETAGEAFAILTSGGDLPTFIANLVDVAEALFMPYVIDILACIQEIPSSPGVFTTPHLPKYMLCGSTLVKA